MAKTRRAIRVLAMVLALTTGLLGCTTESSSGGGGVDEEKIPELAKAALPIILQELEEQCPNLPAVWIVAQVQQESSWNNLAWADDRNGGTAGLMQINQWNWRHLGGKPWGVPAHQPPPPDHEIWLTEVHLDLGIKLACQNLKRATAILENRSVLDYGPIEGMLVCHNAGCGALASGRVPRSTREYVDKITRYAAQYAESPKQGPGGPGDPPVPAPGGECQVDRLTPRKNPRSCAEAIKWAASKVRDRCEWYERCLGFMAHAYGWAYSGEYSAWTHWNAMVRRGQARQGDRRPPPGALLFWKGRGKFGHVALYLGDGKIASNDIKRSGCIDVVAWDAPETKWGQRYLGWSPPYFPNGGGRDGQDPRVQLAEQ